MDNREKILTLTSQMSHHLSYYDVMSDILFTVVCRQDSVMRPTLMILIQNLIADASL